MNDKLPGYGPVEQVDVPAFLQAEIDNATRRANTMRDLTSANLKMGYVPNRAADEFAHESRQLDAARAERKHAHYHKFCPFPTVDVYRVLDLFEVTDPALQHAIKKLLVSGRRGVKDAGRDIQEAIDTLERWKEMRAEERQ